VVTVNNGQVTAVASGNAVITAITADGGFMATCRITVPLPIIPVTSMTLTPTTMRLIQKQTTTLNATILPANATNKTVTWTSSNPGIVSINPESVDSNNVVVRAISTGQSIITATCNSIQMTARIIVVPPVISIQ
jgi:uncharacterized protein YjdB